MCTALAVGWPAWPGTCSWEGKPMGGKPSKGTKADKRLKANKGKK
jgi:hypothetical protein